MKRSILSIATAAAVMSGALASPHAHAWESAARLHRFLKRPVQGILAIGPEGVEFRSEKFSRRWRFVEIHTFDVSSRELTVTTYQNRRWHEPGEQRFHFTLEQEVPAGVASLMAERIGRPARNGAPDTAAAAIAEIPARHATRFGGSNGTLRFRAGGIDYVSSDARDSHSWRWSDIQTIANPDPYTFRVTAFREIAEFELKQPLARALFDKIWDKLYALDLNVSAGMAGGSR